MPTRRTQPRSAYHGIDYRARPDLYRVGRGEQGVLSAEPYKSELLPYWRFATPGAARKSAAQIYRLFLAYGRAGDFVGMDVARKFLQMGYTRARRYAKHRGGRKYDDAGRPVGGDFHDEAKAEAAEIFLAALTRAKAQPTYRRLREAHLAGRT